MARRIDFIAVLVAALFIHVLSAAGGTNVSSWAYPGPAGNLLQQPDSLGNRLLDFSNVGYKGGTVPIPNVPSRVTIAPVAGDDGASIQAAINQVATMPLDANGFRGAVQLTAGEYQVAGYITINASGVVLRGAGDDFGGTVLRAAGTGQRTLIRVSGSGSASTVSGTTHNLTDYYVPVGSRSFRVDSTSGLAVGDRVFVRRIATAAWIQDLGMDQLCCPPDVNPWTPSGYNIDMDRVITRIEGNRITVDAPITCAIEQRYAGGTIRKYNWPGRISNVGVEYLRGISDYAAVDDEDHGWTLVQFNTVENAWVRRVTSQHFGYACVALYNGAQWVTVQDCRSLDPVSIVTGGRRYAFVIDDARLCLVQNCYNIQDRHQFVTQSLTTGPNVFVDGLSDSARSDAGPHHRWATGALWDNVTVNGNNLNIQNRGNLGSGHGWSGANCAAWNCDADGGYVVQSPPTARNWLIGSVGRIENGTVYVGPHDPGTYDSHGSNVFPNSLYYAQLQDRLAAPNLQYREYWLGDIDSFANANPTGEAVPVDPAWGAAVQGAAAGQPLNGFDLLAGGGQWVPFTFLFSLSPNERIVAASLSLSLRASGTGANDDVLYLDSLTNALTLASLGWTPVSTTTNSTVRVLDLANQLGLLADGKLNLALQNDVAIDWALLEVRVAPNLEAGTLALSPAADATVRGGSSAGANFGSATTLTLKEDSTADNDRKAYLRWDLSSITGTVYHAKVRLTPVSVGAEGLELGVTLCTNNAWGETTVTWNNQPGGGKRFATWLAATNRMVEFSVTPQALAALAGDKQLSLQLFSLRNIGGSGIAEYASREHPDPSNRPQLLLLVPDVPPIISAMADRSIPVNGTTGPIGFTVADDKTPPGSLLLRGASSNTNLVPEPNIVFGGSGSNRTVSVTPAVNQSGVATITILAIDTSGLTGSSSFNLTVANHPAGSFVWNGPGAGVHNWSAGANWLPSGPPEALDDVKFFDIGAEGVAVSTVNNFVDTGFGGTIASLHYGNTNGNHTTVIANGRTLALSGAGGLMVGTGTDNGNAQSVNTTITGPGGGLNVAQGNWIVRQATDAATSGSQRATLNMSGLDTVTATIGRLLVGSEGPFARVTGTLYLAKTNRIAVSGSAPSIAVGGAGGGSGNGGGISQIYLGRTNAILADTLAVGRGKQGTSGGVPSSIRFGPAFTNSNPLLGGTVWLRATDGISRMSSWLIADSGSGGGTVHTAGACDFGGGVVDARVDSIIVGKTSTGSGNGNPSGSLVLHAGTLDVNTLHLGYQSVGGNNYGRGQATIAGGVLRVNASLELGRTAGGTGAAATAGTLVINGGTVCANLITAGAGSGANVIAVDHGTLILTNTAGSPAIPINTVAVTNGTLRLSADTNSVCLEAGTLVTGGAANTIHIASLPLLPGYPAQFKLIRYAGAIGGAGYNFVLGSLPALGACGGYLSNNLTGGSIDLVITNCIVPDVFLTWDGSVDANWDTFTPNWKNNLGPGLVYTDGDAVVFNDTAAGVGNINLSSALAPSLVTVSNNLKSYTFAGTGNLTGGTGLRKQGAGTLTLATANDFAGSVTIEGGMVRTATTTALGSTAGPTIITNGGTLDVNGLNLGLEPVTVAGAGVAGNGGIVNNSGNPSYLNPNLAYVTLAGDASFGGTGRWDLRSANTSATNAVLSTGGQPYKLTKVGTNQVSLVAVAVDPALGDIEVQAGTLSVEKVTSSLGNPAHALTVSSGATLQFYQVSNVLNKRLLLKGGATVLNDSGANTFGGTVMLEGSNTFNAGGAWLRFTNSISGPGGLVKTGDSALYLTALNNYYGDTRVTAGTLALTGSGSIANSASIIVAPGATLDVTGRSGGALVLFPGQTLEGNGTIAGSLTSLPGTTVSPGPLIGALTASGTISLQGTVLMELDPFNGTNDMLHSASNISFGGTLNLAFTTGALLASQSFKLFSASGYSGAFSNVVPPDPGPGLMWDASLLATSGTLRVIALPSISHVSIIATDLVISGTNGPPNSSYYVLASTNIAAPLATWTRLATNLFDVTGQFSFTNSLNGAASQRFFRLQTR